jgi:hypothetical protein
MHRQAAPWFSHGVTRRIGPVKKRTGPDWSDTKLCVLVW